MPKKKREMPTLNAVTLKEALWDTLQGVRDGNIEPGTADSIASQSREIIRVTRVQLTVLRDAKNPVTDELLEFASPRGL